MENEKNFFGNKPEIFRLREDVPKIETQERQSSEEIDESEPLWVDFQYGEDKEKGIKSDGIETFVISPISEENLFSDKYLNCTGTVGIGRDKKNGKEIAFLSHQDPEYLLHKDPKNVEKFIEEFSKTLNELVDKSEDKTVEVSIFGGNDDPLDSLSKKTSDYKKVVEILNKTTRDIIGYEPTIIEGPNHGEGAIDVTIIVQERKIIIEK
ncbi:MAG: hypothetical protein WD471_00830 [Candidatus Paceibacterota bacterium]